MGLDSRETVDGAEMLQCVQYGRHCGDDALEKWRAVTKRRTEGDFCDRTSVIVVRFWHWTKLDAIFMGFRY